jgi:hypothetical protein
MHGEEEVSGRNLGLLCLLCTRVILEWNRILLEVAGGFTRSKLRGKLGLLSEIYRFWKPVVFNLKFVLKLNTGFETEFKSNLNLNFKWDLNPGLKFKI